MKKLNPVASAIAEHMEPEQTPETLQNHLQIEILQAQAQTRRITKMAQEIEAQRNNAMTQAAEFATRAGIAEEENKAVHDALQRAERQIQALEKGNEQLQAERNALQCEVDALTATGVDTGRDPADMPTIN